MGGIRPTHLTLALRRSAPKLRDRRHGADMAKDNVQEVEEVCTYHLKDITHGSRLDSTARR